MGASNEADPYDSDSGAASPGAACHAEKEVRVALRVARANASLNASQVDVSRKERIAMVNERWEDRRLADDCGTGGAVRDAYAGKSVQPCADPGDGGAGHRTQNAGRRRIYPKAPRSLGRQLVLYYSHVAPELAGKAHERGRFGLCGLRAGIATGPGRAIGAHVNCGCGCLGRGPRNVVPEILPLQFSFPSHPRLSGARWLFCNRLASSSSSCHGMARFLLHCALQQSTFQAPRL